MSRGLLALRLLIIQIIGVSALSHNAAHASSVPSFFVYTGGGYSVLKSNIVQSNDTSTTLFYGLGLYAGDSKAFGMLLQREQANFSFSLNGSSVAYQLQDLHLRYRYSVFYIGIVIGQTSWQIEAPRDSDNDNRLDIGGDVLPLVDATGAGYGANLGFAFETVRNGSVYLDMTYMSPQLVHAKPVPLDASNLTNLRDNEVELGARLDIDLGIKFNLSRRYFLMTGFRYRTIALGADAKSYKDTNSTTYLGVSYELDRD